MITLKDYIEQKFGKETYLIILCCRVFFRTSDIKELDDYIKAKNIVWDEVFKIAIRHKIRPIIYKILLKSNIPTEIKDKIKKGLKESIFFSFKQAKETERLILLLAEHGVRAFPYKGIAFAKQFYNDITIRDFSDIDIFIKPDDLLAVIRIMKEENYHPAVEDIYNYLGHEQYVKKNKDFNFDQFTGEGRDFHVEFHWKAVNDINLIGYPIVNKVDLDNFSEEILLNKPLAMFNKEEHLKWIMIHHTIYEHYFILKHVVDIYMGIYKSNINVGESGKLNIFQTDRYKQLFKCIEFLFVENHSEPFRELKKDVSYIFDFLLKPQQKQIILYLSFYSRIIKWRLFFQTSFQNKIKFLFSFLNSLLSVQSVEIRFIRLPKKLFFLYYFIRPIRLILAPSNNQKEKNKVYERSLAANPSSLKN